MAPRNSYILVATLYLSTCMAFAIPGSSPVAIAEQKSSPVRSSTASASKAVSGRRRLSHRGRLPSLTQSADDESSSPPDVPRGGGQKKKGDAVPPPPALPQFRDLRKFYIPCLALWVSGPLLSLVDTASIGLSAAEGTGAMQLGALGPATTFIDGSTYLFAFLNVATTNLYASAIARNASRRKDAVDPRIAGDGVVRTASKIALICGAFLVALLLRSGRTLLGVYIGGDVSDTHILDPAALYVRIRAFSMPTTLLAGVLQAALLGAKDSVTPLVATVATTLVNVFGDLFLVCHKGMGTAGAAIATLLAQLAGTAAMLRPARRELFAPGGRKEAVEKFPEGKVSSKSFLAFAAPVLTLIMGKIAAFGVMTHVAAALPGDATLAAHQIVLSLFFFVSPFLEVISQTAQTFLPQFFTHKDDGRYVRKADALSAWLLRLGVAVGAAVACVAASIPRFFPQLLTNDPGVQAAVRPLALPLMLGALLTAPVAVSEGILLARRELGFLASVYVLTTALLPSVLFKVKRAQGPVVHVWACFAGFQLFRAAFFTGKLWGPKILGSIAGAFGGKGEEKVATA
uniref:Polysaccharide biosynthesis protein C-terminal domain-containing protein n=1 Tax=Odontella aurita TaxID=265563 RepID=A0A7S4MVH8_9STRA|mmetsp:Transcript_35012/g.104419  ORF Transcript_35012/g.104419 Transcript_35012/m.104419 type:complete len:572 (+) Transcript_35012:226-1941(+)